MMYNFSAAALSARIDPLLDLVLRQQRLVATVHAVEVADRQGARGARFSIGKSAKYLHGRRGKWFCRKNLPL